MYIEAVRNRGSPPAILLRESYREAGKVKKRTLLNLSDWSHERIAGFKGLLKGGTVMPRDRDAIATMRSLPHGHVDAARGTGRKIALDRRLGPKPAPAQAGGNRCRDLVLALVISRLLDPGSKLAAARAVARHRDLQPWRAARSRGGRRGPRGTGFSARTRILRSSGGQGGENLARVDGAVAAAKLEMQLRF